MKITFDSYADINRLQQLCIWACHGAGEIKAMGELDGRRAAQMEQENKEWDRMRKVLNGTTPGVEVTL